MKKWYEDPEEFEKLLQKAKDECEPELEPMKEIIIKKNEEFFEFNKDDVCISIFFLKFSVV